MNEPGFIACVERYSDEGIKQLTTVLAQNNNSGELRGAIEQIRQPYAEVKKANDPQAKWVAVGSSRADAIEAPPPDGSTSTCTLIFP